MHLQSSSWIACFKLCSRTCTLFYGIYLCCQKQLLYMLGNHHTLWQYKQSSSMAAEVRCEAFPALLPGPAAARRPPAER